jgi:Flp pilus assembly protein TadG
MLTLWATNRSESGAAAVEFALVAPFVLLLLFGMVTTGIAYSDHLSITNAVRDGARYGAAVDYSASPGAWATSVRNRVRAVYLNAGSSVANSQICVKLVDSTNTVVPGASVIGADCGTEPGLPSSMAAGSCAVKVWMKRPADIQLVIAPTLNFDIGAKSVYYYGKVGGSCTAE